METRKASLEVNPYACVIKIKNRFFGSLKTVVNIPREISQHVHFFIKTEGGKVMSSLWPIDSHPYHQEA